MGTTAGGEVVVLDSAGYGAFVISQPVSITAPPGVYAGITAFSGNGIEIDAGASDTVVLRGLTVNNQGSSGSGIVSNSGGTLHIEGCVVNGFSTGGFGVVFQAAGKLEMKDSIIRGNQNGIIVSPAPGTAQATFDQVRIEENLNDGLQAGSGSTVMVRNSVASGNGNLAFRASSDNSTAAELNIESCAASNNGTGIQAESSSTGVATIRVSNSTVTDNTTGLSQSGTAVLLSRVNNTVEGNTTNTSGTIGSYSAK